MTLQNFNSLPFQQKAEFMKSIKVGIDTPFWIERLDYAIKNKRPISIGFDPNLIEFYWQYFDLGKGRSE